MNQNQLKQRNPDFFEIYQLACKDFNRWIDKAPMYELTKMYYKNNGIISEDKEILEDIVTLIRQLLKGNVK